MKSFIPNNNQCFIATSFENGDRNKKSYDLYRLMKDGNEVVVQPLAHLRDSYTVGTTIFPFTAEMDWFKQRDIEVVSTEKAQEIMQQESIMDKFINEHADNFFFTNYLKFEADESEFNVMPVHGHSSVLKLARLKAPISANYGNKSIRVTHISNIGEMIGDVKDGIRGASYREMSPERLRAFLRSFDEVGFRDEIEPHLTKITRHPLKRSKPQGTDLSI